MGDGGSVCCVVLDYCYADLEYSSGKLSGGACRARVNCLSFGGACFLFLVYSEILRERERESLPKAAHK
jgi:hypothetical protein